MENSILRYGAALLCALSLGCPRQELAPLDPCTVSAVTTRVDQSGISKVDMLFMVDNSGSMANKQVKLTQLLPRLVNVLTSGDRYWGQTPPDGITDKERYFTPVKSLNLAVVDTNMGGIPDDGLPDGSGVALTSCLGLGDDGVFQTSTDVAVQGITAAYNGEFTGRKKGDVVLPPDPTCADVGTTPPYQNYDSSMTHPTADELSKSFGCVARVGVRGCPFEQSLEAPWKAVAPYNGKGDLFKFLNGSKGHGGTNDDQGSFVRDDAILAIMDVTDEEDCSITPDGTLLNSSSDDAIAMFGSLDDINMRCYSEDPEKNGLVWPTDRYVQGFKSLKPDNPDLVIFAAIVGVPLDATDQDEDTILARPEMQYAVNPMLAGYPMTSCTNPSDPNEVAYPPRRLVKVAKGFEPNAVVYSICSVDFAPALDKLIEKIAAKLKGNCLPRQLTPDTNGLVQCEVFELLPKDVTKCVPERGHVGEPVTRNLDDNGKSETRLACRMNQVAVKDGMQDPSATGWYYDDFSDNLKDDCNPGEQQRIAFSFGDLPSGAGAVIDCLQPVASVDPNAKGLAAVGSRCDPDPSVCDSRGDDTYKLVCDPGQNTCQISCTNNPDCPPGWECAAEEANGPKVCQLPTCPNAPSVEQEQADAG